MSPFLQELEREIRAKGYPVYRVAEILDGGTPEVLEITPCHPCQNVYSVAKAFVVTAIGMLCDRGLLDPSDKITEILSSDLPQGIDPRWHSVTVDMALRQHLGLPKGLLDIDVCDTAEFGKDYLSYLFSYPLYCDPDTEYCYTDAAFYLLARVVEQILRDRLDAFLWETLFFPLGVREAAWSLCPMGHCMGATGLYIGVGAMAKLGEIYRTGGCYGNRRFLSKEWVRLVRERAYELSPHGNWFGKGGMRGQNLMIFPAQNRVVAYQGYRSEKAVVEWIEHYHNG